MYGSSSIFFKASLLRLLNILADSFGEILNLESFSVMSFKARFFLKFIEIFSALLFVMPFILLSFSCFVSIMCNASTPKASTINRALTFPMPFMAPEDKYSTMKTSSLGANCS